MDFASILSSEIKKRKLTTSPSTSKDTSSAPPQKKYLRRSEAEALREAEYLASQAALERERAEKAAKKRQLEEEEAARAVAVREKQRRIAEESRRKKEEEEKERRRRRGEAAGAAGKGKALDAERDDGADGDKGEEIPDEEAIKRLRALDQPITLFGETPLQRLKRLRRLEGVEDPSAPTPSTAPGISSRSSKPVSRTPPVLTESEMVIDLADIPTNTSKIYHQLASWFCLVLREWDIALASRPLSVKESFQGKAATNAYTQAAQYMVPLFKHLERKNLHPDIFPKVCEIVHHAQNRRYVTANDVYLRLSIGNAAWPIGVTMVGIHERSAREKLHEKGMAAHIMSDEVTRKYLQSIKRCLKFCQTRWPPEDQLQLMG